METAKHTSDPSKQITALYTDVNHYLMGSVQPYDTWYAARESIIREYAAFNWIGLGMHLNRSRTSLGNKCSMIHEKLQLLLRELHTHKRFQLTVFCSVLAQIDSLWHTLDPSDYTPLSEDSTVVDLLRYFKQLP